MEVTYRKVLEHIQTVFPQPVSNRVHDSSFREILLQNNEYNRNIFDFVHQEGMAGRGGCCDGAW
ncbi:MAG: hypothetical protein OEW33_11720 [Nitrospirota bacterium]|nr:hypothetical protein [Nitrospirota bacterium]